MTLNSNKLKLFQHTNLPRRENLLQHLKLLIQSTNSPLTFNNDNNCFRFVKSKSLSPDMGEFSISPPGGAAHCRHRSGEESTNGANLHICFSKKYQI